MRRYIRGYRDHLGEFEAASGIRRCVLIGSATYDNVGDLAISEAESAFLREHFAGPIIQIPTDTFVEYERDLRKLLRKDDVFVFQGGGNMGDLYPSFEFERCEALETFPHIRSIVMPQTIDYRDWESPWLAYSQKTYAKCTDLHLFARERKSEQLMKRMYPTTDVELVPDIVLSMDVSDYVPAGLERDGLLLVLRQDAERSLGKGDWDVIQSVATDTGMRVTNTDTMHDAKYVGLEERHRVVSNMLMRFASAQAVITDRLHGMIFSAITGTPCVAFSNSNGKVGGVYEWIKDLLYIRYVENTEELKEALAAVIAAQSDYPRAHIMKAFRPLIDAL